MFGSEILDVAVGIVFVFLLLSIFASAIREGIEGWLKTRGTHLEAGIRELLQDPTGTGLAKEIFEHPLIYGLYSGSYRPLQKSKWPVALTRGRNLPSYIPSRNFAVALLDLAARGPIEAPLAAEPAGRAVTLQTVRTNIQLIKNSAVQRALLTALDDAQGDLQKAQANVAAWYDSTMDRVSGWYKRSTQWFLLGIGFAMAVALNVNTITVADYLYHNKATREAVVASAQAAGKNAEYLKTTYPDLQKELASLRLPIGWTGRTDEFKEAPIRSLGGWLLTGIAVSFGAPFWFDVLNKFMIVRSTVKPHQKSLEEASDDSQTGAQPPAANTPPAAPTASATTGPQQSPPDSGSSD